AVRDQPKWQLALDQLLRLHRNGVRFDGLTFDEGYGGKVPWLALLNLAGQKFVAEVPVSFAVRAAGFGGAPRADEVLTAADAKRGRCYRISRHTRPAARWRAAGGPGRGSAPGHTLVGAGAGERPRLHLGGGDQRGDGRGEVLRDQRDGGADGAGAPSGVPPGDGRAQLPGGERGSGADALRGAAVRGADPPCDPGADG